MLELRAILITNPRIRLAENLLGLFGAQQFGVEAVGAPVRIVVGQQHQAGHRAAMLLEYAIVVGQYAARQGVVPLGLDFDVNEYLLLAVVTQVERDQQVGHAAGQRVADVCLRELLVEEAGPAAPVDRGAEFFAPMRY